ncbi:hypothetical protein [Paenibacillus caui]|uniref:hypothetical protein n=1 Tax=Paenibacillus caui TaxID=2873927 RepID=UPI00308049E8
MAGRKQERFNAAERNAIEGKFGKGKRRFGLGLIRVKGSRIQHDSNRPPVHGDESGAQITGSFCTFFQNRHAKAAIRGLVLQKNR